MKINEYCKEKGLTQKTLAKELKITPAFLSQLINGHRNPSPAMALQIEQITKGAITRMELLYPEQQLESKQHQQ